MEQTRETRNRPTQIQSTAFNKGAKAITAESTDCLSTNDARTTGHPQANTETTLHPDKCSQLITDLTVEVKTTKAPGREYRRKPRGPWVFGSDFQIKHQRHNLY